MFTPGSTIYRREVLHGAVWLSTPVTVLSDGDVLAVRLDPGAPMTYPPHPFGPHPWSGTTHWTTTTVLQLYRPGDWYAPWRMFDGTNDLGWYVNFEAPLTRGTSWFDTVDYGLDIVIPPDEPWQWKDVDDVDAQLACGRIDAATADQIKRAADKVAADLDADRRWWATWDDWQPLSEVLAASLRREGLPSQSTGHGHVPPGGVTRAVGDRLRGGAGQIMTQ